MSNDMFHFTLQDQPHHEFRMERATVRYDGEISRDRENVAKFDRVLKTAAKRLFLQAR
jgi:hypothetical protein